MLSTLSSGLRSSDLYARRPPQSKSLYGATITLVVGVVVAGMVCWYLWRCFYAAFYTEEGLSREAAWENAKTPMLLGVFVAAVGGYLYRGLSKVRKWRRWPLTRWALPGWADFSPAHPHHHHNTLLATSDAKRHPPLDDSTSVAPDEEDDKDDDEDDDNSRQKRGAEEDQVPLLSILTVSRKSALTSTVDGAETSGRAQCYPLPNVRENVELGESSSTVPPSPQSGEAEAEVVEVATRPRGESQSNGTPAVRRERRRSGSSGGSAGSVELAHALAPRSAGMEPLRIAELSLQFSVAASVVGEDEAYERARNRRRQRRNSVHTCTPASGVEFRPVRFSPMRSRVSPPPPWSPAAVEPLPVEPPT